MKLFVTTAAVLLSLSNAQYNQARNLHLGSGRPGGGAGLESRLQNIVDQCPDFLATSTCPVSSDAIDCTFERPSKSNIQDMDRDDIAQLKEEKKEKLKTCICCDIVSVEDIMDAKEEIMEAKEDRDDTEAGRTRSGGRLQKLKEKKCPGFLETFSCPASSSGCNNLERPARPADEGELVFDDEMMNEFKEKREEFKEKLMECVCCDVVSIEDILASKGDRPSGGGGFGGGRPGKGDIDIQAVLDEKCTDFLDEGGCANVEERVEEEITCERFDALAAGNTRGGRGGRKGVLLYCGCGCRD